MSSNEPLETSKTSQVLQHSAFRALVLLAAAWFVIQGMRELSSIIGPVFLALTLVITVQPLVRWCRKRGLPKWLSTTIGLLAVYSIVIFLFASGGFALAQLAFEAPRYEDKFSVLLGDISNSINNMSSTTGVSTQSIADWVSNLDMRNFFDLAQKMLSTATGFTSALLLMLTVALFMAFDANDIPRRMNFIAHKRPLLTEGFDRFSSGVRSYWWVSTVFGLIVAVLDYFALLIIGVPLALTWALLSFITNYIPNIGFLLGLVPPALLALLEGGPKSAIAVIISYSVLNFVIQTIIQPKFTGDAVGITASVSFLSLIIWSWIIGPLGALLAVPLTLLVKSVLLDPDPRAQWISIILDSEPERLVRELNEIQGPSHSTGDDDADNPVSDSGNETHDDSEHSDPSGNDEPPSDGERPSSDMKKATIDPRV